MMLFATMVASAGAETPLPWLARINMYRAMDQLPPIANDPALTTGAQDHAIYVIKNFAKQVHDGSVTAAEISSESSQRRLQTSAGSTVAPHSEIDFAFGEHQSQEAAIDRWIQGPHHRMLLLNPELQRIGYGYYCERGLCAQIVDVEDGIARAPVDPDKQVAIEFPPANSTMSLNELSQESPDPLSACPGYTYPTGLPITFERVLHRREIVRVFDPQKRRSRRPADRGMRIRRVHLPQSGARATGHCDRRVEGLQRRSRCTQASTGAGELSRQRHRE
jgi:hypothetical protein